MFNSTIRESYQFVNRYDVIPMLPPTELGYRSVERRINMDIDYGVNYVWNHLNSTAYFPGIAAWIPDYAAIFCHEIQGFVLHLLL